MMTKKAFSSFKTLASPPSILVSHLSSSSQLHRVQLLSPQQSRPMRKRANVFVWWDFHSCPVPEGVCTSRAFQAIEAAVLANGMVGPARVTAFADAFQLPTPYWRALCFSGITTTHVPDGGKSSSSHKLIHANLMSWAELNPPPAHVFLISNDRGFAGTLHDLRMSNYNILVASNEVPGILTTDASIAWQWNDLFVSDGATGVRCVDGSIKWRWNDLVNAVTTDAIGKYYNQPPDASLYRRYNLPLEEPFLLAADPSQPNSSRIDTNIGAENTNIGAENFTPSEQKMSTHEGHKDMVRQRQAGN